MKRLPVLCIMGPTAVGKTQLAINLYQHFPCSIMSVDSGMVYRSMDIGTAKPNAAILKQVPHALINLCDSSQTYSAGQFYKDAAVGIRAVMAQERMPLLVGGTMLYFYVLQHGIADLPPADRAVRNKINAMAEAQGWSTLYEQLLELDPVFARQIHPHDRQRIQRGLEVIYLTNKTLSSFHGDAVRSRLPYRFINIGIIPKNRAYLHRLIAQRFDQMLAEGLVDEVKWLYGRGDLKAHLPALRTVGYRQVWEYCEGECDYQQMREKAIAATRQLAKRQLTWLPRFSNVHYFYMEDRLLTEHVLALLRSCWGSE